MKRHRQILVLLIIFSFQFWSVLSAQRPDDFLDDLRTEANRGNAKVQFLLGLEYYSGKRVGKDPLEAIRWFRKSAEQGNSEAQSYLGYMYLSGIGVAKDNVQAANWYRKAADQAIHRPNLIWVCCIT